MSLFGDEYSINSCLAFALQFSQIRASEQLVAQKDLLSKDMQDIKKYIDKYKAELSQEVYDSQEYSIKLIQIPKISNTNRSDLSVEFVNWSSLNEEDKENYSKISGIIKDKLVKQSISNADLLKPIGVRKAVEARTHIEIGQANHTYLWKAFGVRPAMNAENKFDTNIKYCVYDEPHNDYLYTSEWVELLIRLITIYGFDMQNIYEKCKSGLSVVDYS